MKDRSPASIILEDLKSRKIDGRMTSEIAAEYGLSVQATYRFMLTLYNDGFTSECGATLSRNSGDNNSSIKHTHWFFT